MMCFSIWALITLLDGDIDLVELVWILPVVGMPYYFNRLGARAFEEWRNSHGT